jgi:hypothetical protein
LKKVVQTNCAFDPKALDKIGSGEALIHQSIQSLFEGIEQILAAMLIDSPEIADSSLSDSDSNNEDFELTSKISTLERSIASSTIRRDELRNLQSIYRMKL